ncbi:MFS transporter [Kitasatospora sp. NPDC048540]|uniref:MFS transporter n=1 Tax=unclassified Kitasatospora TaxID=2633591 RepID=UPI000B1EDABC|nr:MFS transporter [Kitasatospora sp. MBT63]
MSAVAQASQAAAHPDGRRSGSGPTLVAVALASVLLPLTVTGPAVALPELAAAVHAGNGAAQWVQNAYGVTFAACLLAAGGLADRFGRRRVLLWGIVTFMAMSAVAAAAGDILVIDLARAVQGVGAAGILTSGAAIFGASFTGRARARAFGILGASFGFGLALGPLVAGALVAATGWRSVFWMNVVLGALVLFLVPNIAESRDPDAQRVDWAGLTTFSASLFCVAMVFVQGPEHGWASAPTIGAALAAVFFMLLFVVAELRVERPMFDLSLFRRPTFVVVVCQPFTITFGFVVLLVYLPQYFQGAGERSTTVSGALLMPLTLPVLVLPLVLSRVADRLPLRVMLAASSVLITVGSLWLLVLQPHQSVLQLVGPLLVFGIGVGSAFGIMDNAAVSVVPPARSGMASGIFNTMRITGESIAIAAAGGFLASMTAADLDGRTAQAPARLAGDAVQGRIDPDPAVRALLSDALTSAMHTAFVILAVLALAGAVVTFLAIREKDLQHP